MKTAIVDSRISEKMNRRLALEGFQVMKLPPSSALPEAIASHPDSLIFKLGNTILTTADYCEEASYVFSDLRELYPEIKISVSADELGGRYPEDARLNALVIGNNLFCNRGNISEGVLRIAEDRGLSVINVKQGYPACSVLTLRDSAAITSDEGLCKTFSKYGIRVYKIRKGAISLPPYEYGFIGGACGVFEDKIYFLGNYKAHPSAHIIEEAAREMSYTPISLSDEELVDLGGILFIT